MSLLIKVTLLMFYVNYNGKDFYCEINKFCCGDGDRDLYEDCDDGNMKKGDGCNERCEVEPGWKCEGNPSICEFVGDKTYENK